MRILITGLTLMILSFPLISKAQDSSPRILVWDKLHVTTVWAIVLDSAGRL